MLKKNSFRISGFFVMMLLAQSLADKSAVAQSKNPCNDPEFLRLKSLPKASLTESERKTFNKLSGDCEKFKAHNTTLIDQSLTQVSKNTQNDTNKVVLQNESFATTRNFAILGAMCAAVVSIIIAINSIAESPF